MDKFNPDKEDFTYSLVWVRLYSLPQKYWEEEYLVGIGNSLGVYFKSAKSTK
jgi:hypothetical protein